MVTEKVVGLASAGTAVAAPVMSTMLDGIELKLIALLLSAIAILMSFVCKIMWDMRKENRDTHSDLYSKIDILASSHAHLQGEHDAAFQARGCAYDKERLKEYIVCSMKEVLQDRRGSDV